MSEKDKRAVGYARASTEEQRISIEKQERRIKEYAERNGYELEEIFSEQVSGRTELIKAHSAGASIELDGRPELRTAWNDAIATDADAVLVLNPSRLARKMHYQGMLEEMFAEIGVPIEYVEGRGSWLEERIRGVIDEYEVRRTVRRTEDALAEKVERGEWVGNPPIGYETREGTPYLHRDPVMWPEVEEAKRMYRETDKGYGRVADAVGLTLQQVRAVVNRDEERYERFLPPEADTDG